MNTNCTAYYWSSGGGGGTKYSYKPRGYHPCSRSAPSASARDAESRLVRARLMQPCHELHSNGLRKPSHRLGACCAARRHVPPDMDKVSVSRRWPWKQPRWLCVTWQRTCRARCLVAARCAAVNSRAHCPTATVRWPSSASHRSAVQLPIQPAHLSLPGIS